MTFPSKKVIATLTTLIINKGYIMKSLILFLTSLFVFSNAFALPDGGIECQNDPNNDSYMSVKIVDGTATFSFWESSYDSIQVTAAGVDTFAIVEEKVKGSGEGNEWVIIFSAFMVYNWETNKLSVTTVYDQKNTRTETLTCN